MSRTKKGFTLAELLLVLLIVGIISLIAIPELLKIKSKEHLLREVRTQHPEAVLVVKVTRDNASHYVVTVRNTDGSTSTYTLPRK